MANADGGDQYTGLDRFGRVIDENWTHLDSSLRSSGTQDRFQYGYDADGNVLYRYNVVNATYSQVYTYDDLNRLTGYTQGTLNGTRTGITGSPTNSGTYTEDAVGNMTTYGSNTRTVNAQNELASGTGFTDTYDDNGNLTGGLPVVTTGGTVNGTMTYDAWNDLVSVHYGSSTETFYVDANGLRYASFLGATLTSVTSYSPAGQALEDNFGLSGSATKVTSVWGVGYVNDLVGIDETTTSLTDLHYYAQHDLVYSVTSYVDHFGTMSAQTSFDPYGNPTTISFGSFQAQFDELFQGGRYDYRTQTYTFGARNYSPAIGTWMEKEPTGYSDSANLYMSFIDNPTVYGDPHGTYSETYPPGNLQSAFGNWHYTVRHFSNEQEDNEQVDDKPVLRSGMNIDLAFEPNGNGHRYFSWFGIIQLVKWTINGNGNAYGPNMYHGKGAQWMDNDGWAVDRFEDSTSPLYGGDNDGVQDFGVDMPGQWHADTIWDRPSFTTDSPSYFSQTQIIFSALDILLGACQKGGEATPLEAVSWGFEFDITPIISPRPNTYHVSFPTLGAVPWKTYWDATAKWHQYVHSQGRE